MNVNVQSTVFIFSRTNLIKQPLVCIIQITIPYKREY